MNTERRRAIYRVAHDTGIPPRAIVRACRGLVAAEIARRYHVLARPGRSAR